MANSDPRHKNHKQAIAFDHKGNNQSHLYKLGVISTEGHNTVRQGYRAVEIGYPIVQPEDRPAWRSRDGTQLGPYFHNPHLPWNKALSRGRRYFEEPEGHHETYHTTRRQIPGSRVYHGIHPEGVIEAKNPSFKNGAFYPYGSNRNKLYEKLPWASHDVPMQNPSNFEVRPDAVKRKLIGTRG